MVLRLHSGVGVTQCCWGYTVVLGLNSGVGVKQWCWGYTVWLVLGADRVLVDEIHDTLCLYQVMGSVPNIGGNEVHTHTH